MSGATASRLGRTYRRYVAVLFSILGACLLSMLALNLLVDPLWYLGGNRLGGYNYAFNERISKSNQFLRAPETYDCVIFGSSRATLLDASRIAGHRCFNYAVSKAGFADLDAFARYAGHYSPGIRLVIVGVDGYNFSISNPQPPPAVPPFVHELGPPPDLLSSYLSWSALDFSLRTLRRRPPNDRFYDSRFVVGVVPEAGRYDPPRALTTRVARSMESSWNEFTLGPFARVGLEHYARLREQFPRARLLGYVPPVSAYYIANLQVAGTLGGYLDVMSALGGVFDEFYDFSVPSSITSDPANTYDGSHYYPAINARVAEVLNRGARATGGSAPTQELALAVHALSPQAYRGAFEQRVSGFLRGTRLAVADHAALAGR